MLGTKDVHPPYQKYLLVTFSPIILWIWLFILSLSSKMKKIIKQNYMEERKNVLILVSCIIK